MIAVLIVILNLAFSIDCLYFKRINFETNRINRVNLGGYVSLTYELDYIDIQSEKEFILHGKIKHDNPNYTKNHVIYQIIRENSNTYCNQQSIIDSNQVLTNTYYYTYYYCYLNSSLPIFTNKGHFELIIYIHHGF